MNKVTNMVKAVATRTMATADAFGGAISVVGQRMNVSNLLGYAFGGRRNLYEVFGYKRVITTQEANQRYRRQDIASRIIDAPVMALWSNPPIVSSTDEEWNKAWNDLVINRNLWRAVSRVDKMAGLGDFAVLLIGLTNTVDLSLPATTANDERVIFLQPYDFTSTQITRLVTDPTDERFMKPELYKLQAPLNSVPVGTNARTLGSFGAHYTRILHVAENILADEIFGNPRIERVWNLLDDLLKVTGGTAETYWITANKGLQVDVDKEMELSPDDESALTEEIDEYINNLRRVIRTRGVKITDLGTDVPQPQQIFVMIMQLIAGATGIPLRILLGSEAGQLASGQDRNNWAERIKERRAEFGEPVIIWPLVRLLTEAGALPNKPGLQVTVKWPDPFSLTPEEKANTAAKLGLAANNLTKAQQQNPKLMTDDEARSIMGLDEAIPAISPADLTKTKANDL